jgi:four helix bundle protein
MSEPSKGFRNWIVWQKAHAGVLADYAASHSFLKEEVFGLTSQLRRAVSSVPANIVEGYRRRSKSDKLRFFNIAQASLDEGTSFFILAHDLKYAATTVLQSQSDEVARILTAYASRLAP